jgi:glycosyltransferase involved in cell wall biosynthesis
MLTSIIIRTYNEQKHLHQLLSKVFEQEQKLTDIEVVIVDSGSTDKTLEIAKSHGCRITHISQSDFTFGRSLNYGCKFARGDIFVCISGHCIPVNEQWLDKLIKPLVDGNVPYVYGKQQAHGTTRYSEKCHFDKWFPDYSKNPQEGFFCNNANSALTREAWQKYSFNEDLTGLEDMFLAKQIVTEGEHIAYVGSAAVYHIHEESWRQVKLRYEREAIALQRIMPEVHFSLLDFIRFYFAGVFSDISVALREKVFLRKFGEILMFRLMQFWGTYKGNHEHRKLSIARKRNYFYPKDLERHNYEER